MGARMLKPSVGVSLTRLKGIGPQPSSSLKPPFAGTGI